ncbi:hypothetical protein A4G26_02685 [Mycobacterium kansasii]|uniref:PknH-like extracellular domain-containing protein n=1 Tax=Mycobacterium innocens TaxID=2341083 RepID=A0A498QC78_9MYCO|nr:MULTISPECIES: sensor domain-containing protein [Mycobacterium]KZS56991.1 hypothetical protein A4G26_02685 [Mycobacterium kansasii]VBA41430.1 hypothetical protein LAUMK13_03555 [Mycobacterium innocens]
MTFVRAATVLSIVVLTAGCTSVIGGSVRPAPGLKPNPVLGKTIKQVLLDDRALSKILDQPFQGDPHLPPWFGGRDQLRRAYGPTPVVDCAGVTTLQEQTAYETASIKDVTGESWWHGTDSVKVISVAEGVVALPTAAEADRLFATFSQQWGQCNGETLTFRGSRLSFTDEITDVRVANSVLAATVTVTPNISGMAGAAFPEARAIGIRANCIVEVEVAFFSSRSPADQGSGNLDTSAVDIAHAMMDKVTALS